MAARCYGDSELRWTTLHPEHWTTNEVSGWVVSVTTVNNITGEDSHVITQAFESVTGVQLIKMSREDFINLLGQHGEFMHNCFTSVFSAVPTARTEDLLRCLTPISEKTDSDGSPEPDPDHVQSSAQASVSSSHTPHHTADREGHKSSTSNNNGS